MIKISGHLPSQEVIIILVILIPPLISSHERPVPQLVAAHVLVNRVVEGRCVHLPEEADKGTYVPGHPYQSEIYRFCGGSDN